MLNNIQNDLISDIANTSLGGISGLGSGYKTESDKNYFVDQSDISSEAYNKYLREEDIKNFSRILTQVDENEATERVLNEVFSQKYSIDDDAFLGELLTNEEFLNDIMK